MKPVPDDNRTALAGGIVISYSPNTIAWPAVSRFARGRGIGSALLFHALSCFPEKEPVYVQTFAPACAEGMPARRLYQKSGFVDCEAKEATPCGVPTILMVKSG